MTNLLALTGGLNVPSARFRVRQNIPHLHKSGIVVKEYQSRLNSYPPTQRWMRPIWGATKLLNAVSPIVQSYKYDGVLIQREILSTIKTVECLMARPRIFDVDDAVHLYRNGASAKGIAKCMDAIVCGNQYLADWYSQWNKHIAVIPTAIDSEIYLPKIKLEEKHEKIVIGWIGTAGNYRYLEAIELDLVRICKKHPNVVVRVVSNMPPTLMNIPKSQLEYKPWNADAEVDDIQGFDIGLMPLDDSPWSRGKCSFKMLQYMSCQIPVVVSDVGMNNEIFRNYGSASFGFAIENKDDHWLDALDEMLDSPLLREKMGRAGRQIIQRHFDSRVISKLYADVINKMVRR